MAVNLIRSTRLFPGVPYAYAARASQGDLIFTAGACPLDEQGQVVAPHDVSAPAGGRAMPARLIDSRYVVTISQTWMEDRFCAGQG